MKSILVPIGGSETDEPLFETALAAARPFCGHLQFLHVRVSAGQAAANIPHTEFAMGRALSSALGELDHKAKARTAAAAQHFRDFCMRSRIEIRGTPCRTAGVTASWHEEDGPALNRIMFHARHNDLVVVGRAKKPNGLPADFLESLLVGCGRPILIVGAVPPRTLTDTIMVCWRETPDAARALGVVMPFLINAKRVIVVGVAETNVDHTPEGIDAVSRYLLWNEVAVETKVIKTRGATPELLASAAQKHQADLLVLGAFGHSQMRERLFGGCTQFFIHNAEQPVLMMH
jgi:nucleotide-binding universal stress UspA family protein